MIPIRDEPFSLNPNVSYPGRTFRRGVLSGEAFTIPWSEKIISYLDIKQDDADDG
jgi:hypothetical protein